jgi:hypothetical protein
MRTKVAELDEGSASAAHQFTRPKRMATLRVAPWENARISSRNSGASAAARTQRMTTTLRGLRLPVPGCAAHRPFARGLPHPRRPARARAA